ncbi:TIGR01244 family sulfur transferase [Aestuariibius sp. 2305UL40-4]|uniref:TIGR01244 family sulfur transferase n=1 Tax=Aestuariibius violaceus TaxID=3234132 RepID=UPI00345E9B85
MEIRPLTDHYAVSPQITPEDVEVIRDAGFTTILCNRPDGEVPQPLQAQAVGAAAKAAGLEFKVLPVTHQTITPELVAEQRAIVEGSVGPVMAYCASGTRCTIVWALGQAGLQPADKIIGAAAKAGYDIAGLRPQLDALANG